ncbi:MAG: ferrous iron transport protein B [Azoarcus sp.]|jgi:ferrous iron transport protein B|nr:ferrous iron transport protein B [Azoarcus sp.]
MHHHNQATPSPSGSTGTLALVGHPNVGKSVLFHRLTGAYVNVSNYPGTTVEVARAGARFDRSSSLLDTPGVLALPARSDDERATIRALLNENLKLIIQVGDAKNLRRTLNLTALLAELGVPLVMALNMADEAKARGVTVDTDALSKALGMPVVATVATGGEGISALSANLGHTCPPAPMLRYDTESEEAIASIAAMLTEHAPHPRLSARGLAILLLGRDGEVENWLTAQPHGNEILAHVAKLAPIGARDSLPARLARERGRAAEALAHTVTKQAATGGQSLSLRIGQIAVHPIWGWPLLLLVLLGVYFFVGDFGAGTLVGLLEEDFFGEILNPAVTDFVRAYVGPEWLADMLVGDYGLWTMGMTYALALILPIVTTFFLVFGVLEDSGYFTRLSVVSNRAFAAIGLNGRAVLPMVLGLGCVTMATLTTRILHTPRERLIAIFLLALAIPCSAQLGVVFGMLSGFSFQAAAIWSVCIVLILLVTGWIAGRLVKGQRVPLVTELPPMRLPILSNVLKKTSGRLKWYLLEVIPLFLLGTFIMFVLDRMGALPWIIEAGKPLVTGWLGLPPEASAAFVMGFLRRDFGATGLFAIGSQLDMIQTVVGMVTITLFVPCIASVMIIVKERGMRTATLMLAIIMPTAFFVGGLLNHFLRLFPHIFS